MTPNTWPAMTPFDPDSGEFPPALEAVFARPAAIVPAVLVVAGAAARRDGWAAGAAVAIADAWAERRDAITLADLGVEAAEIEPFLGLESAEGLAEVFDFGLSLRHAARPVPDRRFRFLSHGLFVPDPAALLQHPRWGRLVSHHAEEQATLLVFVPANSPGLDTLARRVGKALVLSGSDEGRRIAAGLPSNCSVLAILGRPESEAPVPDPADAAPDAAVIAAPWAPGGTKPDDVAAAPVAPVAADPIAEDELLSQPTFVQRALPRRRRTAPVLRVLLLAALAAGGWVGARQYLGLDLDRVRELGLDRVRELGLAIGLGSGAASADPGAAEPSAPPVDAEPVEAPLPYSVAVGAYPDFATASERIASLRRAEPQIAFYMAPFVYDSVVYYRVLAGLVADTAAAGTLARLLLDRGHKTDQDPWSVRPTVWSYRIAEFGSPDAAAARADSLLALGVPTYVVEIPYTAGPARYRLYAGAYEGPAQGVVMAGILERAGIEAQLVRRMGRPPE